MCAKVSIVMSCYNCEATLPKAIQSIQDQSFEEWEMIIVNDGSKDHTASILHTFAETDERINLLRNKKNQGLAAALNLAIYYSQAPLIARMDADDIALPNRLDEQYRFMTQHPEVDVLGAAIEQIDHNGTPLRIVKLAENHQQIVNKIFTKIPCFHPTVMMRRQVWSNYGGYDNSLRWAEDADLWYRIYDKVTFHNLPEVLLQYRHKSKIPAKHLYTAWLLKYRHLKERRLLLRHSHILLKDAISYAIRTQWNY